MDEKNVMNEILLAIVNLNNKMDNLTIELKKEIKELREEMNERFDESYAQMQEFFDAGSRAHTKLENRVKELERKIG